MVNQPVIQIWSLNLGDFRNHDSSHGKREAVSQGAPFFTTTYGDRCRRVMRSVPFFCAHRHESRLESWPASAPEAEWRDGGAVTSASSAPCCASFPMCLYRFAILAVMLVLQPIGSDHGKRRAPFEQVGAGGVSEVVKPRLDTAYPLAASQALLISPIRCSASSARLCLGVWNHA